MPATIRYAEISDLRKGDIPLPSYMGDGTSYLDRASEEIDAALGHIYQTPFIIDINIPENRPSILFLKKICWLLASGRLVLDLAAAGENDNQHAYGLGMLKEGLALLKQLSDQDIVLPGAQRLSGAESDSSFTGPVLFNEDPESLVKEFYKERSLVDSYLYPRVRPYGFTQRVI